MKNTKKKNSLIKPALILLTLSLLSPAAMAAGTPVEDAVEWVLDLLTNGIARSLAIIAIVIMGFLAWAGRLDGGFVGKFIVGMVLVFGGATLVDLLIGTVS
jgi:type IV secretion system protein VirB2